MKVKVLRGFCVGLGVDVYPGDVLDLIDRDALLKIQEGRVIPINPIQVELKETVEGITEIEETPVKTRKKRGGQLNA